MKHPKKFLVLALVIISLAYVYPAIASNMHDKAVIPEKFSLHVVKKGDTLWEISKRYMPRIDPRQGYREIRRVNGMSADYIIQPGDILSVPDENGTLTEPLGDGYSSPEAAQEVRNEADRAITQAREERTAQASRGAERREFTMIATAYTQRPEEGTADGITKTETKVRPGVIAVDPDLIPLNSWVYIESSYPFVSGYYHAEDIGPAIKGNRIDIFMRGLDRANDFGKREVRVVVVE